MTALPNNDRTVRLAPSAGATSLAYDFWIARAEDLAVWRVRAGTATLLTLTTDYSVSGAGVDAGGTVTLAAAALAGDAYVLAGSWLVAQVLDLVTAGDFRADDVDHQHRLILAALMEIRRDLARQLGVAIHDDGTGPFEAGARPVRGITYLEIDETTTAAPAADKLRLYAKDVGGVTKLFVRTATEDIDLSGAASAAAAAAASAAAALASASAADAAADAAEAAAAALDIPVSLTGQALKVLRVKTDESGYEHVAAGAGDVTAAAAAPDARRVVVSESTNKAIEFSPVSHSTDGDETGVRHRAQTGYTDLAEIATPANPAANNARLYAKDVAGVTRLAYRDSAGSETELLTASAATAATQAEQEAASSTSVFVTPGRQHFHPSAAKAWVRCGVSGNILASFGVSSVTDTAAGQATVNWATAFSSANYVIVLTCLPGSFSGWAQVVSNAAGSAVIGFVKFDASAYVDPGSYNCAAFGDI